MTGSKDEVEEYENITNVRKFFAGADKTFAQMIGRYLFGPRREQTVDKQRRLFIGGPADGKWLEVEEGEGRYHQIGEHLSKPKPSDTFEVFTYRPFQIDQTQITVMVEIHTPDRQVLITLVDGYRKDRT